jgi:short-subunit dehydrogenase
MQSLLLDLNDSASIQAAIDTLRHELHCSGIHLVLVEPGPITSRFRKN